MKRWGCDCGTCNRCTNRMNMRLKRAAVRKAKVDPDAHVGPPVAPVRLRLTREDVFRSLGSRT